MASFQSILIPATDLAASRALYTDLLGVQPTAVSEYYVGFDVDGQQVGLVPGLAATRPQLHVEDLDAAVAQVTGAGWAVVEEPRAVGGGRRVAVGRDEAGSELGLVTDTNTDTDTTITS